METLAHLFDWLLTASARASLLSVAVLGLQVLLRHRVPARWRYALWLPVLLVLLTPAFPESQWSVGSIVRTAPAPLPAPVRVAQEPAFSVAPSAVGAAETSAPISWSQIMLPAWLLGAAGMIVICLGSYALALWRIKHNRVPVNDALLHEIAALAQVIGLRRVPHVWMSPVVRSPAVTGLWRPVLLLPVGFDESLSAQEARLVLRHELTHLKRGDLRLNALLCLLLSLHWFNPLLWLAFFKVRLDREAACDAQVLDREPQAERVAYGHTLLKVQSTFSHHGLSLGFVGIFQRGSALRSRIQSIAKSPTQTVTMKTTLSLSIALLTFLGITKAAPPDKNAPQMLIEAKFIEVTDGATDLLDSFATTGKSPSVSGMLNDEQLSALWKKIETTKGVDVLSMPRVTTRSGQEARIEIGREFAYKDATGKPATKQLGTTLTMVATKGGENDIDLELSPQIVELEGMIKDAKSGVEQPVFKERKATASVTMMPGQTVVLGLASTSTKQNTEDRSAGRVTAKTENVTRHALVFVTARLFNPATGKPVDPKTAAGMSPLQAKLDSIILPSVVFADATLSEAVEFLRHKSLDLDTTTTDPNQKGVNMIVKAGGNIAEARITLDLKNIPLGEALKYVAQLSNLRLVVERYAVTLISQADFEAQQNQAGAPVSGNQGMVVTSDSLTHDKVSGVVTAVGDVKFETPQGRISAEKAAIKSNTRPKSAAGEIIIPKVQFHEATLAEAGEFLRIKSRDFDPEKKGLNILIKPGGDPMAKITMQLKDVPAYEALRYVAEVAGCKLTVEGDVFVITPVRSERK
jgi:beta-lactamase regulating signal transducer with metallopeptidase domain|uniref:M56 family metallopeptidase n=1 Tax=Prosthecobacter sp. TaxID=1965333 RepID=UPI00378414E5